MKDIISGFILYSELGEDCILYKIADALELLKRGGSKTEARSILYRQIKRLLDLSTTCGFDKNLWQCYLTYLCITNENSFTLTAERRGTGDGTVNCIAKGDFELFRQLFFYDFAPAEEALGINCFSLITHYRAIEKSERIYYKNVSEKILELRGKLEAAPDGNGFFELVVRHIKDYGVGMFGLNKAFRMVTDPSDPTDFELRPVNNAEPVRLSDIIGYDFQKKELVRNTKAFVEGRPCNNVLLYGDAGTGKSTSVKAVLNEFYKDGLRMIEIYKYQFRSLGALIGKIKDRNYHFIIYIDDLSFEENEVEYKFLKAVIEGGVESRPENIRIYATSNRRHLIKETWKDRNDMEHEGDIHRSDTMEEKLSLSARFGLSINYSSPSNAEYLQMARAMAEKEGIEMEEEQFRVLANRFEIRHGGVSGRTARQFVDDLCAGKG